MVSTRSLLVASALLLAPALACGPATPAPATAVVVAPVAPLPPVASRRAASESLRARWPWGTEAQVAVYVDARGLLHAPLVEGVGRSILLLAHGALDPKALECTQNAVAEAREVLAGAKDDDDLIIVSFDDKPQTLAPCLSELEATPMALQGAPEAYRLPYGRRLVHLPGLLLIGTQAAVTQALAPQSAKPLSEGLSLGDDQYVAVTSAVPGVESGTGSIVASASRFRVEFDADLPEPVARQVEATVADDRTALLRGLRGEKLSKDDADLVARIDTAVSLSRTGGHLQLAFTLDEPVAEQARDVGGAMSLGIAGVRRYIATAKAAEARNSVGQIAKGYIAYWEGESSPGSTKKVAKKKLVSLPPVPKTVPSGKKYQSMPGDWKEWGVVRFSMESPQYYQYEVVAAKDGKSADILARGDLNGDGKTSLFRVKLALDPKDHTLHASPLEETDPEE